MKFIEAGKWYHAPEDDKNYETWTFVKEETIPNLKCIWFVHRKYKEALEIFEPDGVEPKWLVLSKLKPMSNKFAKKLFFKIFTLTIEETKKIKL